MFEVRVYPIEVLAKGIMGNWLVTWSECWSTAGRWKSAEILQL